MVQVKILFQRANMHQRQSFLGVLKASSVLLILPTYSEVFGLEERLYDGKSNKQITTT